MTREDKQALRIRVRETIKAFDEAYLAESNAAIEQAVLSLNEFRMSERVFTYYSQERECATRKIISEALRAGKTVALPVVYGGGNMAFGEYSGSLRDGVLGICEPVAGARILVPTERDVMIVPALCCDKAGCRLGRGGGYYDRYLADCTAVTICLCRERLLAEKIPKEWNDLTVNIVITEKGPIRL